MIHLPASVRIYLATSPCDMRRSFDGLHALVNAVLRLDAFAGHLFVFANRRRDRVKILYWDRNGFAVWSKRLEEGTYAMPFSESDEVRREITAQELGALLSGIDLSQAKRGKALPPQCFGRRINIGDCAMFRLARETFTVTLKQCRSIRKRCLKTHRRCGKSWWI
jgi:transposase